MKLKKSNVSSQLLILILAALVLGLMLQMAQAQTSPNQQGQVLQIDMPQKSFGQKIWENTSLNYYTQFLGPTMAGTGGETYNVYVEGRSPYQSFHAANIRYQFNSDWATGVSLAAVNAYGDSATNQQTGNRDKVLRDEFFNARAFLTLPSWKTRAGTLFTTVSYEHPTSNVAKANDMTFGYVLAQSFSLPIPSLKVSGGFMWQYYRMNYKENVISRPKDYYFPGSLPEDIALQTTILSAGPYLNYRHNDRWGMNSSVTFDWDQRGQQAGSQSYNNNLPDRARLGVSYYPTKFKQIQNVGVFTQSLLKYTSNTHVVGAELALKF